MKLRFCGVRGSTPSPGHSFAEFGGNTSCVAVTHDGGTVPSLLLDAGTGIRTVSGLLDAPFVGTILLSHLHWDHVQGLPFFTAADRPGADVEVLIPRRHDDDPAPTSASDVMRRAMSPPHFPIGPEGLHGRWSFDFIDAGCRPMRGFKVLAREVEHKGGTTFGYRIGDDATTIAYLPDHHPSASGPMRDAALELIDRVDVLIHDAQFTTEESGLADAYGHSTIEQAIELAREGNVAELVLFHHSPTRTDDRLERLARELATAEPWVTVATEGAEIRPRPAGAAEAEPR